MLGSRSYHASTDTSLVAFCRACRDLEYLPIMPVASARLGLDQGLIIRRYQCQLSKKQRATPYSACVHSETQQAPLLWICLLVSGSMRRASSALGQGCTPSSAKPRDACGQASISRRDLLKWGCHVTTMPFLPGHQWAQCVLCSHEVVQMHGQSSSKSGHG